MFKYFYSKDLLKRKILDIRVVKSAIISRLDIIKTNPLICESDKLKDPTHKDFRAFVVFSYRVTYQMKFETKELRILRVRHTSREPLGY